MELRARGGPGDLAFFLDVLAMTETTRCMARVAMALAIKIGETDSPPTNAGFIRRTLTAGIPDLLADAERAGIPAHELSTAAIEAWARRVYRDEDSQAVLDGPWNHQEDLPSGWWTPRALPNRSDNGRIGGETCAHSCGCSKSSFCFSSAAGFSAA